MLDGSAGDVLEAVVAPGIGAPVRVAGAFGPPGPR